MNMTNELGSYFIDQTNPDRSFSLNTNNILITSYQIISNRHLRQSHTTMEAEVNSTDVARLCLLAWR